MNELRSKAIGCLAGAAVGDALGSATEGWSHEQILKRYGGPVTGIVAPYNDARAGTTRYQKGDGRVTDDTLMTRALGALREKGFHDATLWTGAENERPRRVYEAAGWRLDGATRRKTTVGVEFTELRYRIELAP